LTRFTFLLVASEPVAALARSIEGPAFALAAVDPEGAGIVVHASAHPAISDSSRRTLTTAYL
jgi:hypothetical protein